MTRDASHFIASSQGKHESKEVKKRYCCTTKTKMASFHTNYPSEHYTLTLSQPAKVERENERNPVILKCICFIEAFQVFCVVCVRETDSKLP